jgi:hypothetical protein
MVYRLIISKSHSIARTPTDNPAVVCDQSILCRNCPCKSPSPPVPKTDNFPLPFMSTTISQSHVFGLSNPLSNPTLVSAERKLVYCIHFHRKCRVHMMIHLAYNLRQITFPVPRVRYMEFFITSIHLLSIK